MAPPLALHRYPYSEYLSLEEHSLVRHEFIAGEIYAMAGGTPEHAALASAILRAVGNRLPAGCRTYTSDLRVRIVAQDVTTYPDGAVICGKVERAADDSLAATNPIVLIEVTSPSTESYDRGTKLEIYKRLDTLREVLVLAHDRESIAVHRRQPDGSWTMHEAVSGAEIELESFGFRIAVSDVYRDIG